MRQFKIFIMLSKSKLYISVLFLAISLGLMPVGAFINIYLRDQVSAEIPDTLLKIKGDVVPEIESQYLGLGVPRVLEGILNKLAPEVSDNIVKVEAIPQTLLTLQNRTIDILPSIINNSIAANIIYNAIRNVTIYNGTTWNNARDQFFNNYDFHNNYSIHFNSSIKGVSEQMMGGTVSLNYTETARNRLLLGHTIGDTDYPGLLIDHLVDHVGEAGLGLIHWLEFYSEAEVDNASRILMETVYSCPWSSGQLQNLSAYITTYLWPNLVKQQYEPLKLETYADIVFYRQWANKTDFPRGLPLEYIIDELQDPLKSATAVEYINSALEDLETETENYTLARELFFNFDSLSFNFTLSIQGVSEQISVGAYSLNYTFIAQERLLFGYNDYPGILENPDLGIGLIQWINLYNSSIGNSGKMNEMETIYNATWTEQLVPFADYLLDYIYRDIVATVTQKGLETGISSEYGILNSTARDLWDPSNPNSIVNESGIKKWYAAYNGNITVQNELNATFEMDDFLIYDTDESEFYEWLFIKFRLDLVPVFFTFLDYKGDNVTPLEYANIRCLQQWANGTLDRTGFDLGTGIKGFEVGIPTPINISLAMTIALFDKANKSAFINEDGILKWIKAYKEDFTVQEELKANFKLDNKTLNMITDWLFTIFKPVVVPNMIDIVTVNPYKCNPASGICEPYTLTELAVLEFYRQWANGSLSHQAQWNDGLDPVWHNQTGLDSIAGWEAGIPQPTNISYSYVIVNSRNQPLPGSILIGVNRWRCPISTVERLWTPTTIWDYHTYLKGLGVLGLQDWDDRNLLSFVTPSGFPLWFKAIKSSDTYKYLADEFELSNEQMDAILDWFIFVQDNFALEILQAESGLPFDYYELGNIYFMSFIITGILLVAISSLYVVWVILSKRK